MPKKLFYRWQSRFGNLLSLLLLISHLSISAYSELPYGWEPLHVHDQLEYGEKEVYSIYVIKPYNVKQMLENEIYPKDRIKLFWKLNDNRSQVSPLLVMAHRFILRWYRERQVFPENTKEGLIKGLEEIKSGKYPLILITKYNDPMDVYQVVSVGYDEGKGIPTEVRCVGRGMTPLPTPPIRQAKVPIRFIKPYGSELVEDKEISDFLSNQVRVVGAKGEMKTFVQDPTGPRDFTSVIQQTILRHQLHLWSSTVVEQKVRIPLKIDKNYLLGKKIKLQYPEIPDELLFPHLQERVVIEDIYLRAHTVGLSKLYSKGFGFSMPLQSFNDPDVPGITSYISHISRESFESTTPLLLSQRKDAVLIKGGSIYESNLAPLSRSILYGRFYYSTRNHYRQDADDCVMRLIDTETMPNVPESSYLYSYSKMY